MTDRAKIIEGLFEEHELAKLLYLTDAEFHSDVEVLVLSVEREFDKLVEKVCALDPRPAFECSMERLIEIVAQHERAWDTEILAQVQVGSMEILAKLQDDRHRAIEQHHTTFMAVDPPWIPIIIDPSLGRDAAVLVDASGRVLARFKGLA